MTKTELRGFRLWSGRLIAGWHRDLANAGDKRRRYFPPIGAALRIDQPRPDNCPTF
jgi:hypothetical protein